MPCGDTATAEPANSDGERGKGEGRKGREKGRKEGEEEEEKEDRKWSPASPIRVKETESVTAKGA